MPQFPDDENGAVLQGMAARGIDLVSPRVVDFEHSFASEAAARAFQKSVEGTVLEVRLFEPDTETGTGWEVQCRVRMIPTHAAITETELRLGDFASASGGHAAGWGFLNNPDGSPA